MTRPTRLVITLAAAALAALPGLAGAAPNPGAYLAARQADATHDFETAAKYYADAMKADPGNTDLMAGDLSALVGLGDFAKAADVARQVVDSGQANPTANIVLSVDAATSGNWADIFSALEAGHTTVPLVDGLSQAWAFVGEGKMTKALAAFDDVANSPGLKAFGLYHKALAFAVAGDFENAEKILSMTPDQGLPRTRRAAIARAQVLSQLGRDPDAVKMLTDTFGPKPDPELTALKDRLTKGETIPFTLVRDARSGLAEMYFTVAQALNGQADDAVVLVYARAAQVLDPGNTDAILQVADLLDRLGRYDLAEATYGQVPSDDPSSHAAELGRAEALRQSGRLDAAIEVLKQLARSHGDLPIVQGTLGDLLRQSGDMAGANAAYTKALDLYAPDDKTAWVTHYTRGITYERMGDWPKAEADFRKALDLNPDQPQVLNYLGYSLVERKEKLDEALAMIQKAVAAQPNDGAIVDSLGWALYRLGQYDKAIVQMERAASLEPVDPVVNDHLGDVLWAVGRKSEARFQWQRTLSFGPDEKEAARIRRKLAVGLDAVLAEEGAPPLGAASGAQ
ncbi:tetratricopeptide repeat protein [Limimaricola sp.]|uniref:tetratricopeptide repeat protein n=1 Tax=Limimaricola sp. TaxID=2211665 RepID=UPI0025BCB708|nr:tetratricopeptide repeat protein [Limimaricola sp.]